jgi:hypothetical protein
MHWNLHVCKLILYPAGFPVLYAEHHCGLHSGYYVYPTANIYTRQNKEFPSTSVRLVVLWTCSAVLRTRWIFLACVIKNNSAYKNTHIRQLQMLVWFFYLLLLCAAFMCGDTWFDTGLVLNEAHKLRFTQCFQFVLQECSLKLKISCSNNVLCLHIVQRLNEKSVW